LKLKDLIPLIKDDLSMGKLKSKLKVGEKIQIVTRFQKVV
jgi:hypothetical protein